MPTKINGSEKFKELLNNSYTRVTGDPVALDLPPEEILRIIITHYENILNCMPGNVFWLNKDCIAVGCNKNELDVFGFKTIDEFRGLNFDQLGKIVGWSPEAIKKFETATREVIETGKPKLHEEEPPLKVGDGMVYYSIPI